MVKQVKPVEHEEEEKKERISYPRSEVPNRISASGESYVKVFSFSIVLLILGILIASMSSLIIVFADPQTQQEAQDLTKLIVVVGTVSTIFLQLGMVVFSLSTFLGAVRGETLSGVFLTITNSYLLIFFFINFLVLVKNHKSSIQFLFKSNPLLISVTIST